ncbi:unnamed protein product [Ceratitis capitata]|uniref:(Mediterranean fruit fly) hypothetical protein n=1 Tax=Ceratitis capitata TaxID=7213 RepID=A0A811UEP7_CERCA|nr:unnamed protein product [Ceratitis capitata]
MGNAAMHVWFDNSVNHLFEDDKLRGEPLNGITKDKHSYEYTKQLYTGLGSNETKQQKSGCFDCASKGVKD